MAGCGHGAGPFLTLLPLGCDVSYIRCLIGLGVYRSGLGPAFRCLAAGKARAKAGLIPVGRLVRTSELPMRTRPRRTSIAPAIATLGRRGA